MDRKGAERNEMNYFKIEAELRASIRELSGGEVRFWIRTDPDWRFEDIREDGYIRFILQIEYETDEVKDEIEQCSVLCPWIRFRGLVSESVLKGILVEMIYNHLKPLYDYRSPVEERMAHMVFAPETSGFFSPAHL